MQGREKWRSVEGKGKAEGVYGDDGMEGMTVVAVSAAGADAEIPASVPPPEVKGEWGEFGKQGDGHGDDGTMSTPVVAFSAAGADAELPPSTSQPEVASSATPPTPATTIPPPPDIDTEQLFTSMMSAGRTPDPYIFPAILSLRRSGRFIIGALSNTSLSSSSNTLDIPRSPSNAEPTTDRTTDVRAAFDLFISSAHVGMRKPEPRIYEYAMAEVQRVWRDSGREAVEAGLRPEDVLFLDDIGANLRAAREMGWRTIKVGLGEGLEALRELEVATGVRLVGERAKL